MNRHEVHLYFRVVNDSMGGGPWLLLKSYRRESTVQSTACRQDRPIVMQKGGNVSSQTLPTVAVVPCFRRRNAAEWLTGHAGIVRSGCYLPILPHGLKTEITTTAVSRPICMLPKIRALEFAA